jgi:hypothetical protein
MKRLRPVSCSMLIYAILGLGIAFPLRGAASQTAKSNWENLKAIAPGDDVLVVLHTDQSAQGRFEAFTAGSITIQLKSGNESLQRENILRISARGQKHRRRNALIGALAGAADGLGLGAIADRGTKCGPSGPFLCGNLFPNRGKEILTPLGAIVGGAVGLALPASRWHEVYRAP